MSKAWNILQHFKHGVSVDVLRNFDRTTKESLRHFAKDKEVTVSLNKAYPSQVADICRHGLIEAQIQTGYFTWTKREEILNHAVDALGDYGNLTDLPLLKQYTTHDTLGTAALGAIERIESRQGS